MATRSDNNKQFRCSFCNKTQDQVRKLVAGPKGVYICDECIEVCTEIMEDEFENFNEDTQEINLMKPKEMKAFLDDYVIGQDEAKKVLSVAVYNHYKRILAGGSYDVELQKSNIIMLGPTGSGKTLLAQTLARQLNVPFAIADATALTEAGYVGEDVENILLKLIQAADYDIERAQTGIIYIDEIDKIARKSENASITRDVSGEGVQQALLKIIEGAEVDVPITGGRKHPHGDRVRINTENILFICGGAFEGLTMKKEHKNALGFGRVAESEDTDKKVDAKDIEKQGIIPELIGRLPVIVELKALTEDDIMDILTKVKNSITQQYTELIGLDDVQLTFSKDALKFIAHKAVENGTGARGLRAVIEDQMTDLMFELPDSNDIESVVVTVKNDQLAFKKNKKKMEKVG